MAETCGAVFCMRLLGNRHSRMHKQVSMLSRECDCMQDRIMNVRPSTADAATC